MPRRWRRVHVGRHALGAAIGRSLYGARGTVGAALMRMTLPRKILVPTDFSEDAGVALDYAVELAATVGATVHVAHFYAFPLSPFGAPLGFASADVARGIESETESALATFVQKHARSGVNITASARVGDARSGIQEAANDLDADLICMGTHGRRGLSHILLGSIAEYTVRVSKVPTLTVRAQPSA